MTQNQLAVDIFRMSFLDENDQYLSWDNSVKSVSRSPGVYYQHPIVINADDFRIGFERNLETFGVFRSFTLPMVLCHAPANILRFMLHTYGYEAYTRVVIERKNMTTYQYETLIDTEVDYTQFHGNGDIEGDEYTVHINLMDNSIAEFLKSNESVTQEVDLLGIYAQTVVFDGIVQKNAAKWLVSDGLLNEGSTNPTQAHVLDTTIITTDGENRLDVKDATWLNWSVNTDFVNAGRYLYVASTARPFTFEYNITVHIGSVSGFNYAVDRPRFDIFRNRGGVISNVHTMYDLSAAPITFIDATHSFSGTFTDSAQVEDEYYVVAWIPSATTFMNFNYDPASWITLKYYDRLPTSGALGMKYFNALNETIKKASDNTHELVSDFLQTYNAQSNLDSEPANTVIVPAESIKGTTNSKLKATIADLLKFGRVTWMLGMGAEGNKLRVEPLTHFFRKDDILFTLDSINDFGYHVARDLLYTAARVGYEPQSYDKINGADEFNTTEEYKLPNTRLNAILDLISPIRADMYGIEALRMNRFINTDSGLATTTTTNEDNTLFAVGIEVTGSVKRMGNKFYNIVPGETTYNAQYSPKRALIRNLPHIYSILPNHTDGQIQFKSIKSEAGGQFISQLVSGYIIDENGSIDVNNSPHRPASALFLPYIFEFECKTPANYMEAILSNPYGAIRFKVGNQYLKGFIVSVEADMLHKDSYQWTLLSTPDNDMSLLNTMPPL